MHTYLDGSCDDDIAYLMSLFTTHLYTSMVFVVVEHMHTVWNNSMNEQKALIWYHKCKQPNVVLIILKG